MLWWLVLEDPLNEIRLDHCSSTVSQTAPSLRFEKGQVGVPLFVQRAYDENLQVALANPKRMRKES